MPFVKGQSGNPGGRPKAEQEVLAVAREHGPEAVRKLVELSKSQDERVSLAACNALLDRAYGKPKQVQEVTGADGDAVQIAVIERRVIGPKAGN